MPPRLSHRKSRKGCQRCKARKVKCDEVQPVCSACQRHDVACIYSDPDARLGDQDEAQISRLDLRDSPSQSSTSGDRLNDLASPYEHMNLESTLDPEQRRLLELRLLHYFTTVVAFEFPATHSAQIRGMWRKDAVRLAFEFDFLLNALLAMSALHATTALAEDTPAASTLDGTSHINGSMAGLPRNWDYAQAHRIYLNMAIKEQRQVLSDIKPANADAICLTSIAFSIIAIRLLPLQDADSAYTPPTQWLSMANAISTCVQAAQPFLQEDSVMQNILSDSEPDFQDQDALFNPRLFKPFEAILDFPDSMVEDEDTKETYRLALAYVGSVHQAILRQDPVEQVCRRVMSIGSLIPRQFVSFIEQRRARALVILAHHMAMAKYADKYWWLRGAAEREVYGIQSILPPEWQWAMKWPLETLQSLSETPRNEKGDNPS